MTILSRLIYKEIFFPLIFSFIVLSAILLLGRLLPLTGLLLRSGIGFSQVLHFILVLVPTFLLFVLPLSGLLGTSLAMVRLNKDNELIAIFAAGISPKKIFTPVLVVGVCIWILTFITGAFLLPKAKTVAHKFIYQISTKTLTRGIPPLTFVSPIKGLTLFVNVSKAHGRRLKGVFLQDARNPKAISEIFARKGEILTSKDGSCIILSLKDGTLHQIDFSQDSSNIIKFDSYILKLYVTLPSKGKSRGEMGLKELIQDAQNPNTSPKQKKRLLIEFNKRLALPIGALILAMLGAPLGIKFGRTGISGGVALSLSAFIIYYILLVLSENLAEVGMLSPWISLWIPNILFAALTWWLWKKIYENGPLLD